MGKRFLERKDIRRLITQANDFTIRWRGMHVTTVGTAFILCFATLLLICMSAMEGVLEPNLAVPVFLLAMATLTLIVFLHQCYRRVTYVEFLALLFASSARLDTAFMMILNRRGIVVYCDGEYDRLFKELPDVRDFQEFLALEGLKKQHADALTKALMERTEINVPFEYQENGEKVQVELQLRTLPRPANYNVLRAVKKA